MGRIGRVGQRSSAQGAPEYSSGAGICFPAIFSLRTATSPAMSKNSFPGWDLSVWDDPPGCRALASLRSAPNLRRRARSQIVRRATHTASMWPIIEECQREGGSMSAEVNVGAFAADAGSFNAKARRCRDVARQGRNQKRMEDGR